MRAELGSGFHRAAKRTGGRLGGRGVAVLSCPPEHAATSNLGQAELKRDACLGACEKQAAGIRRHPQGSVHV